MLLCQGARLVSHLDGDAGYGKKLTTGAFATLSAHPQIGRSMAANQRRRERGHPK